MYRQGAGGQGVELAALSSYLGSSAHLAATYRLLRANPDLPTALLPVDGGWAALGRYIATLPPIALILGRALVQNLPVAAASEFPMVWCGLGEDDAFVYSRIDALTHNGDGSVDLWEWKTRWGRCRLHEKRAALRDIRQAVFYCFALTVATQLRIERFHIRYAGVAPDGGITVTTHTFRFDPPRLRSFLQHALERTTAYADHRYATTTTPKLDASSVMPAYNVLQLAGIRPLLHPTAAAAKPRGPWLEHPAGALWVPTPPHRRVLGLGPSQYNGHKELDAAIKARAVALATRVTRCVQPLARRLARLFGGPAPREGRRLATPDALVIRALNRGINGLVASGAADADMGFVHDSGRHAWSREAIARAHDYIDHVAGLIDHEIRAVCRRRRQ